MVEDDGAEVPTVVVGNEVLGGVGALQTACPNAFVLQQCLVQSKQHLRGEKRQKDRKGAVRFCIHILSFLRHVLRRNLPWRGRAVHAQPEFLLCSLFIQ